LITFPFSFIKAGIVESGSGKSVTSLAVMGLVPTQALISGAKSGFEEMMVRPHQFAPTAQARMQQYRADKLP